MKLISIEQTLKNSWKQCQKVKFLSQRGKERGEKANTKQETHDKLFFRGSGDMTGNDGTEGGSDTENRHEMRTLQLMAGALTPLATRHPKVFEM